MNRTDSESFPFYPDAYIGDLNLKQCSMAAIGLWSYMLCLMYRGSPCGHLTGENGNPIEGDLWKYLPIHPDEVGTLMTELETHGIFSRTDTLERIPYSRRMVKDHELREKRRAGGRLGGNPALMFDAWYKRYPVKKGRQSAAKAFQKALRTVSIQTLLDGVDRLNQAVVDGKQDGQYIPHPATWLNGGRWDDEFVGKSHNRMELESGSEW